MADMYRVRVLSVEGDRLICRVTVDYRGESLTPSRTVAFRFVWEPWWDLTAGRTEHLPNGKDVSNEQAREMGWAAPLSRELAERDMDDLDWNCANADRFIRCVGVTDFFNYDPLEPDATTPEEPPQATYTILATEPDWLVHLSPGMEWGTTAFDDDIRHRIEPSWRSPDVLSLAKGIDASQDFSGMPVLADALQEAGCDCGDLLSHLRDPACKHACGCWALEQILDRL